MKKRRHAKILEIIKNYDIETQEDLQECLRQHGFEVTQATISRDIRELKLVKETSKDGKYIYSLRKMASNEDVVNRATGIFHQAVLSYDYALNTVCIKCHSGMAGAACAAIDSMHWEGVLGTIAGDDTIFVLCRSEEYAHQFVNNLEKTLNVKNS